MKKIFFSLVLVACTQTIVFENLKQLTKEEKQCEFLYTINTESNVVSYEDALLYLKKQINKKGEGNAFFVKDVKKEEVKNRQLFAPEYNYILKVNVYNCAL